ncbi:peptide/nickel transport system ATP-binding protein/oligopeptide transport system ATP-binding protein [Bosea sp. AK1]|uniref:ATP-binding cassette domain-containing protein n=1 Tax=Bosea sp. AK1 TaxID=2587160 RepID=UPI00116E1FAF|nr:ABC transporter ATP-binding protein [Bosea sp. AK1]TQI75169.1 peptide/nickel transport system ATP-binding protein/oligopeptide transport system ATP-binding protein [Bosea sp. AK1]
MTEHDRRAGTDGGSAALLSVEGLTVGFRTAAGYADILHSVSFAVRPGTTTCVVGESGSGKSVSCQTVLGLLPANGRRTAGRILFEGRDLAAASEAELETIRGRGIGMVFQDPLGSLNPLHTVGTQLRETLRLHTALSEPQRQARALELLRLVGIPEPEQRLASYVHQFSGGMAQRVMIAMALACEPKLLIADEPTTALDVTIQAQILDLLNRLKAEFGMAILFVTHDLGVVAEMADDVVVMRHGRVVEAGPAARVLNAPEAPYTRELLAAMPRLDVAAPIYRERVAS